MPKTAKLEAEAVKVLCPHCEEPQGVPGNGSHLWLPEDVERCQGTQVCDSCGERFTLQARKRVNFS